MRPLAAVFLLALLARVAGQVVLGAYVHPVTWEYEDIANNLLAGRGYIYVTHGTTYLASVSSPLYVLLTAGVYALTAHSAAAMLVLQVLAGAAAAGLAAWLAERAFGRTAAWIAGCLVALDAGLVVYAAELHSLTLDALGFLLVAWATVAMPTRPAWWRLGLLGTLIGLAALSRTTALILLPIVFVWLVRWRGLRSLSPAALALVAMALLTYSPWPIRNSVALGQFVPGSSEATEWFWRGTNPAATGSSLTPDGRTMLDAAPPAFQERVYAASEAERIGIYRDAALQFIHDEPARALGLYVVKLRTFWWGSDQTGQLYPPAWVLLYRLVYLPCLVLGVWGGWRGLRNAHARPIVVLLLAVLVSISAAQAIFYVEGRHRLALEPLLLVLSAAGLAELVARTAVWAGSSRAIELEPGSGARASSTR